MTATLHAAPETITVPDAPEAPAAADPTTDTTPAAPEQAGPVGVIIELAAHQVAQHPDNVRDASRGITELTASVREVGVLVPLIVVPVQKVPGHQFGPEVTHVAVDGNRRQAAAAAAGVPLRCEVRADLSSAKATARTMAVTGLMRDGLTAREEAHAVSVLFDAKMSGAAIGRALGRSTAAVKTARRAAALSASKWPSQADYPLTLDQMADPGRLPGQPGSHRGPVAGRAAGPDGTRRCPVAGSRRRNRCDRCRDRAGCRRTARRRSHRPGRAAEHEHRRRHRSPRRGRPGRAHR